MTVENKDNSIIENHLVNLLKEMNIKDEKIIELEKEVQRLKQGFKSTATNKDGIYSYKKKNGTTCYGFTIYDDKGVKKRREGFRTKSEALHEKRTFELLKSKGKLSGYLKSKKVLFKDLTETYLNMAETEFAINTLESSISIIKNHMSELLELSVDKITKSYAREFMNNKRSLMLPSAYNNLLKKIKAIWNYALNNELIASPNPFVGIKPINIKQEIENRAPVRLNKQQANLIVEKSCSYDFLAGTVIGLALYTGVRLSECLGVKWMDIDFEQKTLNVSRQVQRITKKRMAILLEKYPNKKPIDFLLTTKLKTESSRGIITIPTKALEILQRYKDYLVAKNDLHELCFCDAQGLPLVANDFVRYRFKKILEKVFNDKNFMRFHELRGSCATILHLEGVKTKIIQDLLRHGQMAITEDTYIQLDKTSVQVSDILNKAFEEA